MTCLGGVVSNSSDRQAAAEKVKGRWGKMLPEGPDAGTMQGVAPTLAPRPLLSSVSEQGSQILLSPGQ